MNKFNLNDSNFVKNSEYLNFLSYNSYFFGENHNSELTAINENKIINIIGDKVHNVFVETPVNFYYPIQDYILRQPMDTTTDYFKLYSGDNEATETLLRFLYKKNLKTNHAYKYKLFPIDMIYKEAISNEDLLQLLKFRFKIKPKSIKKGIHYLNNIVRDTVKFKNEDSLIYQYILFKENFYSNLSAFQSYLRNRFAIMKKNIDGIYTYSLARKEDTIYNSQSNSREEFMLNNIMEQIKKDSIKSFISINGAFHIPLTTQKEWVLREEWESLAARFKNRNPGMKVCSVYFMDSKVDNIGDEYFPVEKKAILENTKPGETYLIRLDGENSPFKELSEKFQYIVVW